MKTIFLSFLPLVGISSFANTKVELSNAFTPKEVSYFNSLKDRKVLSVDSSGKFKLDDAKLISQIRAELQNLELKSKNLEFKSTEELINALKPNNYYNLHDDAEKGNSMSFDKSEK